jgi:hypothetical protein
MMMLQDDHGPQGDRTAAEWEKKLQALDVTKGITTTIATYQQCVTNLERVRSLDDHDDHEMPVVSADRAVNSYCPSNERLKRFLLYALEKAPFNSPYCTMAQDRRLSTNTGCTPE